MKYCEAQAPGLITIRLKYFNEYFKWCDRLFFGFNPYFMDKKWVVDPREAIIENNTFFSELKNPQQP